MTQPYQKNALTTVNTSFVLTADSLQQLGLTAEDEGKIREVAARIDSTNPSTVAEFGRDVSTHSARFADQLLDQVRNRDLDQSGEKLSQVLSVASSLNLGALSDNRSRVPIIGPLLDKIRLQKNNFMSNFDSTSEQIEKLVGEVAETQGNLAKRIKDFDVAFDAVSDEHRLLGIHIAAARIGLQAMLQRAEEMRSAIGTDPMQLQRLSDLETMAANLDKRIGDLVALQQSALQTLPMIRMMQANNQSLVDKFHTIQEISIPSWKRQFTLQLTLNEQRNGVQLAEAIDDATNTFLRRNVELLRKNSVATAAANQRLAIDVDTLSYVHETLLATVKDVIAIHREGVAKRDEAVKKIEGMRRDMRKRLVGGAIQERVEAAA